MACKIKTINEQIAMMAEGKLPERIFLCLFATKACQKRGFYGK